MRRNSKCFAQCLIVAKGEELVLDDRTTDREAWLIAQESARGSSGSAIEPVIRVGIEAPVAIKLENGAVVCVRAALDGADHNGATGAAVFGRRDVGVYLEFLRGIDVREYQNRPYHPVVIVHAVEDVVVCLGTKPVDRDGRGATLVVAYGFSHVGASAARSLIAIRAASYARRQKSQVREVAPI